MDERQNARRKLDERCIVSFRKKLLCMYQQTFHLGAHAKADTLPLTATVEQAIAAAESQGHLVSVPRDLA